MVDCPAEIFLFHSCNNNIIVLPIYRNEKSWNEETNCENANWIAMNELPRLAAQRLLCSRINVKI